MTRIWTNLVDSDEDFTEGRIKDMQAVVDLKLTLGLPLRSAWPDVTIVITSEFPPVDAFFSGGILIVSDKLARIFREELPPQDFELLPVSLEWHDQKLEGSYFFFNIMNRVDALDRQRSKFTSGKEGWIDKITCLVLDEQVASAHKLFALNRSYTRIIGVRDDLAERIELEGCRGVKFVSPAEWRPY